MGNRGMWQVWAAAFVAGGLPGTAAGDEVPWLFNVDGAGVALGGYDVVSFHDGSPAEGRVVHRAIHDGVHYWFTDEDRLERFLAEPDRYLPACGGWDVLMCGVDPAQSGFGQTRWRPTPTAWRIHDGRLLLLSDRPQWNTAAAFDGTEDPDAVLARADAFWADRLERARRIGQLPVGMDPMARLELADWFPLLGAWRCEGFVKNGPDSYRTIGTADWTFGFGYDGHVIVDHWRPHDNPASSGPATRTYDPVSDRWSMVFIPSTGPSSAWWVMTGTWQDGELHGEFEAQGGQVLGTIRFHDIEAGRFEWISNRSNDGGETWIENFQRTSCIRSAG